MATLDANSILDLVKGTLKKLGRFKFEQIAQDLQDYEMMGRWLKEDKMQESGGIGIQRNLMTSYSGDASHVGLFEVDNVNVSDVMAQMTVPWRHATTSYAYERREILMNSGDPKSMVFNIIKPRRAEKMISLAEELEDKAWAAPSTTSVTDPYGVPYYVVANDTTGFNGGNPGSHTSCAGINSTTTPGWKNYTAKYTSVTKTDLIKKMRAAHWNTRFMSPVDINDYRKGKGQRFRIYTTYDVLASMEDIGEAQNENLGRDIASMDGTITFRKHPIMAVPWLQNNVSNAPVYMIDHNTWYPVVLSGDYMHETPPKYKDSQHNVIVVHVDLSYNFVCVDRRRNAVLTTGA